AKRSFPAAADAWCSKASPDHEVAEFNEVSVAFYPFGNEFHLTAVPAEHARLLGARLVKVDGRAIESLRKELRSFHGGTDAYRDLNAAEVLASPDQLHAVGLSERSDRVTYEVVTANGEHMKQTFTVAVRSADMRGLPLPERAPWAFQEPQRTFRV